MAGSGTALTRPEVTCCLDGCPVGARQAPSAKRAVARCWERPSQAERCPASGEMITQEGRAERTWGRRPGRRPGRAHRGARVRGDVDRERMHGKGVLGRGTACARARGVGLSGAASHVQCSEEPCCFPSWQHQLRLPHPHQTLLFFVFFSGAIQASVGRHLTGVLICVSLRMSDAEHLFTCPLAVHVPWTHVRSDPPPIFRWHRFLLALSRVRSSCILDIGASSGV